MADRTREIGIGMEWTSKNERVTSEWTSCPISSSGLRTPPRTHAKSGWATPETAKGDKHRSAANTAAVASPEESLLRELTLPAAPSVIDATCALLNRMVNACSEGQTAPGRVTAAIFHSVSVPAVSAGDYLVNYLIRLGLARKEDLVDVMVLHALCLVDRLIQMQSPNRFHLCSSNVHRVLLTSMLLSSKVLDDDLYNNRYWSSVGGVSLSHLNQLEVVMMSLLEHRLLVSERSLEVVRQKLLLER